MEAPPVKTPVQKDDSSPFNRLVAQIVAESADAEPAPTPAVPVPTAAPQTVKLPPKSTALPTPAAAPPLWTAPAPLTGTPTSGAPAGGCRADTRSSPATSNAGNAQPPSLPVDVNIPVSIEPKVQLPSSEQKPVKTAAVSSAEEPAAIMLEPKPILEVKIHLNQPAAETSSVQPAAQSATVSAPATRGAQGETTGQQNPQRGSADPGDADTGPAPETSGRASPRTADSREAVVIVQQQTPDAGATLPVAHESTAAPVAALPAPPLPAPAPMTARSATPEPMAANAPPREESAIAQTKTQQPLRSLALEFSPDGAGDIKVRLSERAGDVHISLHGTDASLAGRVREGVGDLVGSLSKAGYDAETWTPGQGRQNQRQQPDQRQSARDTGGTNAEEFSGIFQPIQEIS